MRLLLLLALGCARSGEASPPPSKEITMAECTVTIAAGQDLAPHLKDGAVICLGTGVHDATLRLDASVTLKGEDGAILDAGGRGPVLRIDKDELEVTVENLVLRNGDDRFGSGVVVEGYSTVKLLGCTIEGNAPDEGGGNGLRVSRGWVTVKDGRIGARDGVVVATTGEVHFEGGRVEGDMRVLDGARVKLHRTKVGRLVLRGTTSRAPTLMLEDAEIGKLENDAQNPGTIVRE